jgi:hypothetical protein
LQQGLGLGQACRAVGGVDDRQLVADMDDGALLGRCLGHAAIGLGTDLDDVVGLGTATQDDGARLRRRRGIHYLDAHDAAGFGRRWICRRSGWLYCSGWLVRWCSGAVIGQRCRRCLRRVWREGCCFAALMAGQHAGGQPARRQNRDCACYQIGTSHVQFAV